MKKRYFFIILSVLMLISYIDLVDSCRKIDHEISKQLSITQSKQENINECLITFYKIKQKLDQKRTKDD